MMYKYTIIAGVYGTGKTSFREVLEGQRVCIGYIIDPNAISKENGGGLLAASKKL